MRNTASYSDRNFKYCGVNEAVLLLHYTNRGGRPRTVERVLDPLNNADSHAFRQDEICFRYIDSNEYFINTLRPVCIYASQAQEWQWLFLEQLLSQVFLFLALDS